MKKTTAHWQKFCFKERGQKVVLERDRFAKKKGREEKT